MKSTLKDLIGSVPKEGGFKKRMRLHQGWWRACVLLEPEGEHPLDNDKKVCNTIAEGESNQKNFLMERIFEVAKETIQQRRDEDRGMIQENRLFNNLLSSQPLCFNFFAPLKLDKKLALQILQRFFPEVTAVKEITFEFAPLENYTDDNSAFDVAIEVCVGEKTGLIGFECKFTDSFSAPVYDKPAYKGIFESSSLFRNKYADYIQSRFNQLFRNQLIAESLAQKKEYDFLRTGLFCHQDDLSAIQIAQEFQNMLNNGREVFRIVTYRDFIEAMQKLELTWEQRELSMLLWSRYCGTKLSEEIDKEF